MRRGTEPHAGTVSRAEAVEHDDARILAFERGEIERFGHREHLELAWRYLRALGFEVGAPRFAAALRALASARGAPEKFHATMTWAFLVLIAERLEDPGSRDLTFDDFVAAHPELLDPDLVASRYGARLADPVARRVFVLP